MGMALLIRNIDSRRKANGQHNVNVPIEYEARWAPEPVWTGWGKENLLLL
jgi:hypothetical protein